jgi:DNA helicase-2/ATP-dependent DNA helicase PcrA
VRELLEVTRLMNDNGIALPVQKIDTSTDGVHLVTAHGAKGAEYKLVFIIGGLVQIWDAKYTGNRQSFKLPDNLSQHRPASGELEESRRLFYVAVTRAKAGLEISYPARDTAGKDQVRSSFVSEIMDGASLPCEEESASAEQLAASIALEFAAPPLPQIALIDRNHISRLLSGYTLSVTHLNNYLSCPIKFYYQNLIRVPAAKSDSMTFGSAVHFALQRLFEKMKEAGGVFGASETLLRDFAWYMERNRESFTADQFNRRMQYGQLILPAYYDFYHDRWNKAVRIEWNIRQAEIMGVPVNGKLDKIETGPDGVNVVDYKTGKYENAKKKLKRPDASDPLGGDYWRQAVFYKLLLDNDSRAAMQTRTVEFDFIEPVKEEYKTEKIEITSSDIEIVTAQVKEVWEKIGRHEFSTGCGKEDCHWCNFVKDNKLTVPLHHLAEAAEEEA